MLSRLENVMSATRHQTSANECQLRKRIYRRQFADAVEQEHAAPSFSPPDCHLDRRQCFSPEPSRSSATTLQRSGCRGARIISACGNLASTLLNASSTSGSSPSTVLPQTITGPAPLFAISAFNVFESVDSDDGFHVELQIAADLDLMRRRADLNQPSAIHIGLCQKQVYIPQHLFQQ